MSILKRLEEIYRSTAPTNIVRCFYIDDTSFAEIEMECDRAVFHSNPCNVLDHSTDPPTYRSYPVYRVRSKITHMHVAVEPE